MLQISYRFSANSQAFTDSVVGADAHIGPLGSYDFAGDPRKIGAFCRADVGIGPYSVLRKSAAAQRAEQSPAPTNCVQGRLLFA